MLRRVLASLGTALVVLLSVTSSHAGTTGSLSGRVVDSASQAPLSGVSITVASPSQTETAVTDAAGRFSFVSLAPDTYAVTAKKDGFDTTSLPGVTVFADQTQTITVALVKTVAVLGKVNVTASGGLVRPGTTADVYSVSGANASAAGAAAGTGNLNQAYSAMASVPGVTAVQGQQGWYQPVYIRGGDLDQVGWEFDGIPVNRTYDNAPQTFLSNLGQQELQVYTGGTSATADASGISGYVNQVIKRGSYPGFKILDFGVGGQALYNKASFEIGSATPDGRFSYYLGSALVNQSFRYIDNGNGGSRVNTGFFYPVDGVKTFAPGYLYGIADTSDHESVANFHYKVGKSDDVQLLYLTSYLYNDYYSSLNDLYGNASQAVINGNQGFPVTFADGAVYAGALMQAPVAPANSCVDPSGNIGNSPYGICYFYPATPHAYGSNFPRDLRESNTNGVSITKLQYQKNFSSSSYLRIFGYGLYSNWFIHGPLSATLNFGAEIGDYELPSHTYGLVADYTTQLNDQNQLTLSGYYSSTHIQRYTTTGGFPGNSPFVSVTSDVLNGNCYDSVTGLQVFCNSSNAPKYSKPVPDEHGTLQDPFAGGPSTPLTGSWIVTETGYRANFNKVNPVFDAVSINDNWKPTDRLSVNAGVRVENYRNNLNDSTVNGFPARAFWINAYNNEFCFAPGYFQPLRKTGSPTDSCAADWPLSTAMHIVNTNPGSFSHVEFQPRLGVSFEGGPDDVFRASAGVYSRPASTREASWNVTQQNIASFLGVNFAAYGAFTPNHDVRPDRSTNFDLSWEHHFTGSDVSFKVTPFYRSTQDQVQQTIVNALTGLFASFNTGRQVSSGVEFAITKGNFAADGWAMQFAYTHTHSSIKFNDLANGRNVIDNMNAYVQLYNSYTSACAGIAPSSSPTSRCGVFGGANAFANEPGGSANPYFTLASQPLFDRTASYAPYDLVPVPFAGGNGYEVPDVATVIVGYKRGAWNFTPSLTYSSGSVYGSPLSWPGPDPIANPGQYGTPLMIPDPYTGKFDGFGAFKQPSRYTLNMQIGYQMSKQVRTVLTLSNIVDHCSQRGYAWDYSAVCSYSNLPSGFLSPTGGTLANAAAGAIQLKYPYAMWLNNNNTGFIGTQIPFQASLDVNFKV
jgi:hypothetical protein